MVSASRQSDFDPYDFSGDDEEHLQPIDVSEMTPGQNDRVARLSTCIRLYFNAQSEIPEIWWQAHPNLNNYHYYPSEMRSTFWILDITDWWR